MMAAEANLERGLDPSTTVEAALAAYRRAVELNPAWGYPHVNAGIVERLAARWDQLNGVDSRPHLEAALASLAAGEKLLGPHPTILTERTEVRLLEARGAFARGASPAAALTAANEEAARLLADHPDDAEAHRLRGEVGLGRGRWRARNGQSPLADLDRASRDLERSLVLNPSSAPAWCAQADVALERATFLRGQRRSGSSEVDRGLAAARQALGLNSQLAEAHLTLARLLLLRGGAQDAEEAGREVERARGINPLLASRALSVVPESGRRPEEGG
jgi:tetratricopeptide (TPR) repeat protein